jgi:hypothetical protein
MKTENRMQYKPAPLIEWLNGNGKQLLIDYVTKHENFLVRIIFTPSFNEVRNSKAIPDYFFRSVYNQVEIRQIYVTLNMNMMMTQINIIAYIPLESIEKYVNKRKLKNSYHLYKFNGEEMFCLQSDWLLSEEQIEQYIKVFTRDTGVDTIIK